MLLKAVLQALFLLAVLLDCCEGDEEGCSFYLAASKIAGFGRGVFAGKGLQENETLFDSPTVLVGNYVSMRTMLAYYVFGDDNENYEMMVFGPMLMLNHADDENVDYDYVDDYVLSPRYVLHSPYSTHTPFKTSSLNYTSEGTELFTNYGKQWFRDRRIKRKRIASNVSTSYTMDELAKTGHCLSDIYTAESSIPYAGKGVFAKKPFKKGDLVTVSPVLILPKHAMEMETEDSILLNYCITSPDIHSSGNKSDVALLPFGLAGMMNHGHDGIANVEMEWFKWPDDDPEEDPLVDWTIKELEESRYTPLYLKYSATRDIAAGEEITVYYGAEWEQEWTKYLDNILAWHEAVNILESQEINLSSFEMLPPQFRAPLNAPPGLFPPSFFAEECLGAIPCEDNTRVDPHPRILHDLKEMDSVLKAKDVASTFFTKSSDGAGAFDDEARDAIEPDL